MAFRLLAGPAALTTVMLAPRSLAAWKAGSPDAVRAVADRRIAEALAAVNEIDRATVSDDHAAFAALLADDLVVNNPQNGVSVRGATWQRSTGGGTLVHASSPLIG